MLWRDYNVHKDQELDLWISPSYDEKAQLINQFAFFHESVSEQHKWYVEHPNEMSNIADLFKVVEINGEIIALFILNYFTDDGGRFMVGINPMVIHPKKINQGYGQRILADFMKHVETIVNGKVEVISAGIDLRNQKSTVIFKKLGFQEVGRAPDDPEFVYYEYPYA